MGRPIIKYRICPICGRRYKPALDRTAIKKPPSKKAGRDISPWPRDCGGHLKMQKGAS